MKTNVLIALLPFVLLAMAVPAAADDEQSNHAAAFLCILAAVGFTFLPDQFHAKRLFQPQHQPAAPTQP